MIWNFIKNLFFSRKITLASSGRTDTGKRRSRNEDNFAIIANKNLFIVADGMGGHNAGDIASQNAVNILAEFLIEHELDGMAGNEVEVRHTLINGFSHTNKAIMEMSSSNNDLTKMGCTLIACFVDYKFVHFCHVGDVRGYIAGKDSLSQITNDHTFSAEIERNQGGKKTTGKKLPPKNIVSQAIGFPFTDGPEYNSAASCPGNRIIICSDGLWGMLNDPEMYDIITSSDSPEQACDQFIEQANEAGGKDNITAVTVFLSNK